MKIINGKDLINMEFIETEDGLLKRYEKKGKFIPKLNQTYYYVSVIGCICETYNCEVDSDKWIIAHNHVFETEEECEKYRNYLIALDKYSYEFSEEEWKDTYIIKHCLYFDFDDNKIYYSSNYHTKKSKTYFKSLEDANNFVNEIGEENVKRFMFGVYE